MLRKDYTFPKKIDGLPTRISDFPDLQIDSFAESPRFMGGDTPECRRFDPGLPLQLPIDRTALNSARIAGGAFLDLHHKTSDRLARRNQCLVRRAGRDMEDVAGPQLL